MKSKAFSCRHKLNTMKQILVPTDFSPASHNAARYALSLAREYGADLILLNVTPPSVIVHDSMFASVMITQAEIIQQNRDLLDKEMVALDGENQTNIKALAIEGFFAEVIPETAKNQEADLIVMGMKGKGKSNSLFGSTTTAIIRKGNLPVLVIPENASYKKPGNITLASDYKSDIEPGCCSALLSLAEKFKAPVQILHVERKEDDLSREKAVVKMRTSLLFKTVGHTFHTITENNVEEGIHKFMEENPTDLLAMVAGRHNLFERLFGKVHTKEMSYQSKIPLLVLKAI